MPTNPYIPQISTRQSTEEILTTGNVAVDGATVEWTPGRDAFHGSADVDQANSASDHAPSTGELNGSETAAASLGGAMFTAKKG